MKMIADNEQTETVDRRDLGVVQQRGLLLQMLVFRLPNEFFSDRTADPLPHFRRRRIGKGHDKKPVNIHRMRPVADHLYDPLD